MRELYPQNTFVAPAINDGNRLAIGEAPGEVEQLLGEPLVGPSGSWLRGRYDEDKREWRGGLYSKAGVRDAQVSRANTLQCRPPQNVYPTDPDGRSYISLDDAHRVVRHCRDAHLLPLLLSRDWTRIDLLGDKALRVVGEKDGGILRWRGSPIAVPACGPALRAVPTLHPSALARDQRFIPVVVHDLKKNLVAPPEDYNARPELQQVRDFRDTCFAFDIETDRATDRIICIGLSASRGSAICVPAKGEYLSELKRIFYCAEEIVGHNCIQFDLPHLRSGGIDPGPRAVVWDTMLLQHLLQPDLPHDLGFLGSIFTNKPAWKHESGDDLELYCCLAGNTLVPTTEGLRELKDIRVGDKVETFSVAKGRHFAPVSRLLKRRNPHVIWNALRVSGSLCHGSSTGAHKLVLTHDHRVLTKRGWLESDKLVVGDVVLLPRDGASSLIHGTLLGDGYASPKRRLTFSQANRSWAEAKAHALGRIPHYRRKTVEGVEREQWEVEVGIGEHWRDTFYEAGVKKFIAPPDLRALAVWYCDDGCLAGGKQPRLACPASFDKEQVASYLEGVCGKNTISFYCAKNINHYTVALKGAGKRTFLEAVAPFVHPSSDYKLPEDLRGHYTGWLEQVRPQEGVILEIEHNYKPTRRGLIQTEYCITVPSTGCFFTVDGLVANCRDTDVTWQSFLQLRALCKAERLLPIYERISSPLASICLQMHLGGIQTDPRRIEVVRDKLLAESAQAERDLPGCLRTQTVPIRRRVPAAPGTLGKSGKPVKFQLVPAEETQVPWRSPDALGHWLYEELGLPEQLHAKSAKRTSDKTALAKLQARLAKGTLRRNSRGEAIGNTGELAGYISAVQKLRKLDELLTTFVKGEMLKVERQYPHFNVHGTSSGRLSSSEPNLQNIPEAARYVYIPSHPTWRFLEVDYSQLENRLTAWFANDTERLARLSQPGFSEHKWLASEFFSIPYAEVVKDNDKDAPYGKAKRIGHGTNYGMGAKKIAGMYDMDLAEVKRLLEQWRVLNAVTVEWQGRTTEEAKRAGVLTNPFGRKRWFCTDSYYTESLSFLPQSTGADIMHRAAIGLFFNRCGLLRDQVNSYITYAEPIPAECRVVLQVHDSFLLEGPGELMLETARIVKRVLTQPWPELGGLAIPVELKLGEAGMSWGELEPLEVV